MLMDRLVFLVDWISFTTYFLGPTSSPKLPSIRALITKIHLSKMKFKPPPKRKKVDDAPPSSSSPCTPAILQLEKTDVVMKLISKSPVRDIQTSSGGVRIHQQAKNSAISPATQTSSGDMRIQHARNSAMAQARQDGCKGNFKVFDSPFGNYLVPVIPTREELGE